MREGKAEALMKGSLHTDELMGAVVRRDTGLRTARRVSHCFVMDVPTYAETLIVTDAAVNIAPTMEDKVDIIQNAIDLAHALRFPEVRVAILSAMETVNPKVPSTVEAGALCKMADRGQITGAILDGPLALDNAISLESVAIKKIDSPVAGRANVLVVPDLEAGNMLAKSLSFLAGADAAGIVLGARGADHPHQPRRLGDDAARLVRRRGAGRASARRESAAQGGVLTMADAIAVLNAGSSSLKFSLFAAQRRRPRARRARPGRGPVHVAALRRQGRRRQGARREGVGRRRRSSATPARSTTSSRSCARGLGATPPGRRRPSRRARRARVRAAGARRRGGAGGAREVRAARAAAPAAQPRADPDAAGALAGAAAGRVLRHGVPPRRSRRSRRRSRCRRRSPTAACAATASTACPTSTSPARCRGTTRAAARGQVVVLHLGNGASMCAIAAGRSVASTMGFTAADGLPMGTRCGNLDPGVVLYLMDELQHGRARHREADLPAVGPARRVGHLQRHAHARGERRARRAKAAIDLYVYRIGRELGSLAAALGGLDAIVFTAGIGENSRSLRERVCRDAAWLGVELDAGRQRRRRPAHQHRGEPRVGVGDPDQRGTDDRAAHAARAGGRLKERP